MFCQLIPPVKCCGRYSAPVSSRFDCSANASPFVLWLCYCQCSVCLFCVALPISSLQQQATCPCSTSLMARSKSWKIRNITIEDVPAINALHNYAIAEGFQEWNVPLSMQYHEDLLGKMLQHGYQGLIAEDDNGKVIAFGLLPAVYWASLSSCVGFCSSSHSHRRLRGIAISSASITLASSLHHTAAKDWLCIFGRPCVIIHRMRTKRSTAASRMSYPAIWQQLLSYGRRDSLAMESACTDLLRVVMN